MAMQQSEVGLRLGAWLAARMGTATDLRVESMEPVSTGASAETVVCSVAFKADGASCRRSVVLRRESPAGPIFLDTSLVRQGQMMRAIRAQGIPTAEIVGIEPDVSVLGAPFMVMEKVEGRALPHSNASGWLFDLPPAERGRVWRNSIETIGALNRLDWRDGLRMLDKPRYGATPGLDQYLGWALAWRDEVMGPGGHEILDEGVAYLCREKPSTSAVDVLWGDPNPGNFLYADDLSVAAALDFEAAALGPGEVDLGWWLLMDDRRCREAGRLPGLPERDEMVAIYQASLGRAVDNAHYFEVLAAVRMSLVLVRSVARLKAQGRLPATCAADRANPYCAMLAERIGLSPPDIGEDFDQFRRAVRLIGADPVRPKT